MKLDPPINKQNVLELVGGLSPDNCWLHENRRYNPIHYEGEPVACPTLSKNIKENLAVPYRSTYYMIRTILEML